MKLTEALKKHLRENFSLPADAKDEEYRKAVSDALLAGTLTAQKLADLSVQPPSEAEARLRSMIAEQFRELNIQTLVADAVKGVLPQPAPAAQQVPAPVAQTATVPPATVQAVNEKAIAEAVRDQVASLVKDLGLSRQEASPHHLLTRHVGFQGGAEAHQVRVKKAIESYDSSKSAAVYSDRCPVAEMRGQPVVHMDRPLNRASQADKAVIGAYTKWCIASHFRNAGVKLTDHDQDLMEYAVRELSWCGHVGGDGDAHRAEYIDNRRLTELEQKALLNDAVSGGTHAVPVVYDDQAILAPLQTGELYPWVETRPLARGRVVRAFSVGTVVLSSGVPEGTPIPLFDTTGFIAGLDTTIYPVVGAIEIGLDFEEDSPANFGQIVIDQYGQQHLAWLDEQIALGDGTIEPLGIFNTATIPLVSSANGAAGPLTLSDLEALIFGVNRLYRRARGGRLVFIMSDVTYRRFRAIATATGWNTRLFGTNYEDYSLLGYPVRIATNLPNNYIAFVNMAYYRMYRRQGLEVRVTTEGKELTLKNLRLIAVRALWGGRLMQGSAGALMVDAQA